jgi:hypothetical protein
VGKHFIDPKSSEILSSFSLYDANCPFLAKTAPCPFPWYPCPFEIQEEAQQTEPLTSAFPQQNTKLSYLAPTYQLYNYNI